jgi:threonine aldolase
MIYFNSDYTEGAHPKVLQKLVDTNLEQTPGYGADDYCRLAAAKIKAACGRQDADVHFLMGGTQTNLTVISAALRPHQGVISALSGHISIHESGAVEATGHKVISLPGCDGKLSAAQINTLVNEHWKDENHEHMVQPKMVYISNPTEIGTLYSRTELTAISHVCREHDMILYLDGARLGYGLAAPGNDLDLPVITELCDAFSIGGTKVGALFGEALVITNPVLQEDFRYIVKQKGGMLAKGRLLGLQFLALFEDGLYTGIAAHAVNLALRLKEAFQKKGYPFLIESTTNQQFPILPDAALEIIGREFTFSRWERTDETHTAVRFCTSWATRPADVERLISCIEAL